MSKVYTIEEVVANLKAAQARIKPAVLVETPANGNLLAAYLHGNNQEPTTGNFVAAINAKITELQWVVKPAKLVAMEKNERPATYQTQEAATKPFTDKVKAGEKAEAQRKLDDASIAQAKSLIIGYTPTKSTPRGESIDYADQTEAQRQWTAALNQAIEKKLNLQDWVKVLSAAIQKRYHQRELANERL